jgi:hypothetical protein
MTPGRARAVHAVTALVATAAVVLQLVLVIQGNRILDETNPPDLGTRLIRFASYLTIWSNVLVAATTALLALDPDLDGRLFRTLRLNGLVIVFGGGVVHFLLLRPLLDLDGADLLADRLLHMIVPLLAVVGWLVAGPRGRIGRDDLGPFLVVPVVWIGYTLARGALVDWYPYPFIDVVEHGYAVVALNTVGVAALMLALFGLTLLVDRRLPPAGFGSPSSRASPPP